MFNCVVRSYVIIKCLIHLFCQCFVFIISHIKMLIRGDYCCYICAIFGFMFFVSCPHVILFYTKAQTSLSKKFDVSLSGIVIDFIEFVS